MKPLPLLLLLAAFAACLGAQATSPIGNTIVNDNAAWMAQYDIDHGSTAQVITIDVKITTTSTSGLKVRILDTDDKSINGTNDEASGLNNGPGIASAQLVTGSRSGVHPVLVIVQTSSAGTSQFTGSVDVNVGGLTRVNSNQAFGFTSGLFIPFGLYASFNGDLLTTSTYTTNVVVDFGAAPQTMDFFFEGIGTGMTELRLYDITGGDTLIKTLYATGGGNMSTGDFITTPSYSGQVEFRVEVQGNGSAGSIFWAMWTPSTVSVVGGSGDGVTPPSNGGGSSGRGGGCAAEHGRSLGVFALLCLLATTLILHRGTRQSYECRATAHRD